MILTALAEYEPKDASPPGYAQKRVGFELQIDPDGNGAALVPLHRPAEQGGRTGQPRLVGQERVVPAMARSNNPPPLLGCDNAAFVLGLAEDDPANPLPPADRTSRAAAVSQAMQSAQAKQSKFVELLDNYGDQTGDPDIPPVLKWYRSGLPGLRESLADLSEFGEKAIATDLISVKVAGSTDLASKPQAQQFWAHHALATKGSGTQAYCLVCGKHRAVVDTLPSSIVGSLVPGASASNVALASTNFPSAQRGATGKGLRSSPICGECGTRAVQAFNSLASSEDHRWGRRDDKTAMLWWQRGGSSDHSVSLLFSLDPEPGEVRALLDAARDGASVRPRTLQQVDDRFYGLIFSGNVARLVVRSWIDLPLREATVSVARWFTNSANASSRPFRSISAIAQSAGPVGRGTNRDQAPEGLAEGLIRTALTGQPPPAHALTLALARARAEHHLESVPDEGFVRHVRSRSHARASLIRLVLNYTSLKENPMPSQMDPDRSEPAYLHGRLFALRENIQFQALGEVNAGIGTRFFSRASVNPAAADGALCRLTELHLAAMRRKPEKRGLGITLAKQYELLRSEAGDPPVQMSAEEQGVWMTGYYQQRAHRPDKHSTETAASNPQTEIDQTEGN